MNNIIYTDVDGCLLDWEQQFHAWMTDRGYSTPVVTSYCLATAYQLDRSLIADRVVEFNESAHMISLPPFRDARSAIARLLEHGYTLHAVTSQTKNPAAQQLRIQNLQRVFGQDAFVDYTFLDTGARKNRVLHTLHKGNWWIEDKDENALDGLQAGLRSLLVAHKHNSHVTNIPRFDTLNSLVDYIILEDN